MEHNAPLYSHIHFTKLEELIVVGVVEVICTLITSFPHALLMSELQSFKEELTIMF